MLKQRFMLMSRFFTRERFGHPQLIAGLLLVVFLGQCVWLTARAADNPKSDPSEHRIFQGLQFWRGQHATAQGSARSYGERDDISQTSPNAYYSAMYYLIAAGPFRIWPGRVEVGSHLWGWLARLPYLAFGVLLGASLWYVARRLYGNRGGYIALVLYSFAPGMVRTSSLWFTQPEVGAAWGSFGAIFTAIAVAHTLYAPREVVLWNWRRIVLLGFSLALAIGSQFSLVVLIPIVLAFLLYLAPTRPKAVFAIWSAASATALLLLFAAYCFRPTPFWAGLRHARLSGMSWQEFGTLAAYRQLWLELSQISPALSLAVPAALIAYFIWRRARYFGNTAPLVVAALFLILGLASPQHPGLGFRLMAVPFLFLFVAGVFADLMETPLRQPVEASVWGLLGAYGLFGLTELYRAASM